MRSRNVPRTSFAALRCGKRYPPPPSVEEEYDSLVREHNPSILSTEEEGPTYVGDPEQFPVIIDVPENNPERRFVLVTQPGDKPPEYVKPQHENVRPDSSPVGKDAKTESSHLGFDVEKKQKIVERNVNSENKAKANSRQAGSEKMTTPKQDTKPSHQELKIEEASNNTNNIEKSGQVSIGNPECASTPERKAQATRILPERKPRLADEKLRKTQPERSPTHSASEKKVAPTKASTSETKVSPIKEADRKHQATWPEEKYAAASKPADIIKKPTFKAQSNENDRKSQSASGGERKSIPFISSRKEFERRQQSPSQSERARKLARELAIEEKLKEIRKERERGEQEARPKKEQRTKSDYEANTCRKYVLIPSKDDKKPESPARNKLKERKSRQELPRLDTKGLDSSHERMSRPKHRRSLSATELKHDAHTYFEPGRTANQNAEFLSPTVIKKNSTRGNREENYHHCGTEEDSSRRRHRKSFHEAQNTPTEHKDLPKARDREAHSSSPIFHRAPSVSKPAKNSQKREPSLNEQSDTSYWADGGSRRFEKCPITANYPGFVPGAAIIGRSSVEPEKPKHSSSRRYRHESPPSDAIASSSEDDRLPYPKTPPMHGGPLFEQSDGNGFVFMPSIPNVEALGSPEASKASSPRISNSASQNIEGISRHEMTALPRSRDMGQSVMEKLDGGLPVKDKRASRISFTNPASTSAPLIANPSLEGRPRSPIFDPYHRSGPMVSHWKPPNFQGLDGIALTYRSFLQGVGQGVFESLPSCPKKRLETGYSGWLTLPRCDGFTICHSCYQQVFENTEFESAFMPSPLRSSNIEAACSFGSSYWYQIAWFLTLKHKQPDLRILMTLADIVAGSSPCPGMQVRSQVWYSIRDPYSDTLIPSFGLCGTCVKVVGALLPTLAKEFHALSSKPKEGMCSLRCESTSRDSKFLEYFDALENIADVSMMNRRPPDMQQLSDRLQYISTVARCPQDVPVFDRCWFFMRNLEDFTICKECFNSVVRPWIEQENKVAKDFYTFSNHQPVATCQLYSKRMRDVFDKACRRKDMIYLESKVKERKFVEADVKSKIRMLISKSSLTPWEEDELDRLTCEWADWE